MLSSAALLVGGGGGAAWRRNSSHKITPTWVSPPAPRVLSSWVAGTGAQKPVHGPIGSAALVAVASPAIPAPSATIDNHHRCEARSRRATPRLGSVSPPVCIIFSPRGGPRCRVHLPHTLANIVPDVAPCAVEPSRAAKKRETLTDCTSPGMTRRGARFHGFVQHSLYQCNSL
jgi:hypothetical protein